MLPSTLSDLREADYHLTSFPVAASSSLGSTLGVKGIFFKFHRGRSMYNLELKDVESVLWFECEMSATDSWV